MPEGLSLSKFSSPYLLKTRGDQISFRKGKQSQSKLVQLRDLCLLKCGQGDVLPRSSKLDRKETARSRYHASASACPSTFLCDSRTPSVPHGSTPAASRRVRAASGRYPLQPGSGPLRQPASAVAMLGLGSLLNVCGGVAERPEARYWVIEFAGLGHR
jgi:hypothetical protein